MSERKPGITPLMIAVLENQPDVVRSLLNAGADRSAVDGDGFTALRLADICKRTECARLLRGN